MTAVLKTLKWRLLPGHGHLPFGGLTFGPLKRSRSNRKDALKSEGFTLKEIKGLCLEMIKCLS